MVDFSPRVQWGYVILLLCVCLIAFRGLPSQPWTYDDLGHLREARDMQSDFSILFQSEEEATRWVLIFYYFVAYKFLGEDPAGYHTVNILFHFFNSLLCARLFQVLFRDSRVAALSGFLFAINCVPYEAVYWVTTAGVLMGTTFSLCAVLFSIHYWATGRWYLMIGAIGAYAAAVLSYETLGVIFLPIAFLWWKQKRFSRHDFILPVALIAVAVCWVLADKFWYQTVSGKITSNALQVGFHIPYNFAFFIGRLLINAHFTPFGWSSPPPFDVPETVFNWYVVGGILLLAGLAFASFKHEMVCFSTMWISTTVLPYLTGPNYYYVPRFWYLSTIGGSAILAQIILYAYARISLEPRRRVLVLAGGLILLSLISFQKIKYYEGRYLLHAGNFHMMHEKDDETAIRHYTRVRSEYHINNVLVNYNLGVACLRQDQLERATQMFQETVRLKPNYPEAVMNLGVAYLRQDQLEQAIQKFQETVRLKPDYALAFLNMGHVFYQQGQVPEAIQAFSQLIKLKAEPRYAADLQAMGLERYEQGDISGAAQFFLLAIQANPKSDASYYYLGVLLQNAGKTEDAVQAFQKALSLNPGHSEARANLEKLRPGRSKQD